MTRTHQERLQDILDCVGRIALAERFLGGTEEDLGEVAFQAILYNLVVIGEAVRALPVSITSDEPEALWSEAVGLRNLLTHRYHRVDRSKVAATIDEPLRHLEAACRRLLAE